jgi:MerR family transcriptional regulator, light-induced transcriptional regulator
VDATLTIGQLAERAGTQPGTLRMWETRYGFPRARRLASGHRRYPESELVHVREVLALRETGLSLPAAIERVLAEPDPGGSIFAGLRRRLPELDAHPVPKSLLEAMSHAIEDEASARGAGGLLAGSFQRERFYRSAEQRWRTFAGPTALCFVLADFDEPRTSPDGPLELPLDGGHPLAREWSVVWDAPEFAACLAARERTRPDLADRERIFDTLWSVERSVVREAAQAAVELASQAAPDLELAVPARVSDPAEPDLDGARRATAVTNRMLGYVADIRPGT